LGFDLIILGRLDNLGESTLASAGARWLDVDGRPYIGIVNINYNKNYSYGKSQEYFESIIIHEFTHILGFSPFFSMITYFLKMILMELQEHILIQQKF